VAISEEESYKYQFLQNKGTFQEVGQPEEG
jgi:hypothetical protein